MAVADDSRHQAKRAAFRLQADRLCDNLSALTFSGACVSDAAVDDVQSQITTLDFVDQQLQKLNEQIEPFIDITKLGSEIDNTLLYHQRIEAARRCARRFLTAVQSSTHPTSLHSAATAVIPPSTFSLQQSSSLLASALIQPSSPVSVFPANATPSTSLPTDDTDSIEEDDGSSPPEHYKFINLPNIDIQTFDGDPFRWTAFWSQFRHAIHGHPNMPGVTKLYYLKTLLKGKPLELIEDYEEHSDNYQLAVNILKAKYGDKNYLRDLHSRTLLKTPKVNNPDDKRALQALYSRLKMHVAALKRLKVDVESFYTFIKPMVPSKIYLDFVRLHPKNETVSALLTFVQQEIDYQERRGESSPVQQSPQSAAPRPFPTQSRRNLEQQFSQMSIARQPQQEPRTQPHPDNTDNSHCLICDTVGHWSRTCTVPRTIAEKKRILAAAGRCVQCFRLGHNDRNCNFPYEVCRRCGAPHFQTMCPHNPRNFQSSASSDSYAHTSINSAAVRPSSVIQSVLCTARVIASSHQSTRPALCLIDSGSQRSFIQKQLRQQIKAKADGFEHITAGVFGGGEIDSVFERVTVTLTSRHSNSSISLQLLVIDQPSTYHFPTDVDISTFTNILQQRGLPLADDQFSSHEDVQIIIGMDFLCRVVTGNALRLSWDFQALETIFGWTLHGRVTASSPAHNTACHQISVASSSLHQDLKKMWHTEALGVDVTAPTYGTDFNLFFQQTTSLSNLRYTVALPWLPDRRQHLQSNRGLAFSRYKSLISRLTKNPQQFNAYADAIEQYMRDGHAELVPASAEDPPGSYYLPHQPVYSPQRSTPLRVVFDASSHVKDAWSLNDCLFPGSERSLSCVRVLLRFRARKWGLVADVRKAFLQIILRQEDRDAVRFFWMADRRFPHAPPRAFRMCRVLFGVTSSPYLLRQVINFHASSYLQKCPQAAETILSSFYVDDLVASADEDNDVTQLINDISFILHGAGFALHKIMSNNLQTMRTLYSAYDEKPSDTTSVLGLQWNIVSDELMLKPPWARLTDNTVVTKRSISSASSAIFDPLGFMAPFSIRAKLIFQLAWIRKLGWDEPLDQDLKELWTKWLWDIQQQAFWAVPRFLFAHSQHGASTSLHIFSDASNRAYGSVAYAVSSLLDRSDSTLIMSRFYVAPMEQRTVPELELMAAVVSTEIADCIGQTLPGAFQRRVFWTDSTVNLNRIHSKKTRTSPFVNHRLGLIRASSFPDEWHHVSSEDNPADVATKFRVKDPMAFDSIWWHGPTWLALPAATWPTATPLEHDPLDLLTPKRMAVGVCTVDPLQISGIHRLIDNDQFNSWDKLLRVSRTVVRAASIFLRRPMSRLAAQLQSITLWLRSQHTLNFPDEYKALATGKPLSKTSHIIKLRPFLGDDGLIHIRSRISTSKWLPQVVHPILLAQNSRITFLLIQHIHWAHLHAGVSTTITILRQRYWAITARRECNKAIQACLACQRCSAPHFTQPPAPLPDSRTSSVVPFSYVGVDYAGPVFVKFNTVSVKSYIVLFSCATSRAIHLELVTSATTKDFLLAFQRFVARRGVPAKIYSDNGANLRCAARALSDNISGYPPSELRDFCDRQSIQWEHIAERAPWWGGFWERMVRSVKEPLKRILHITNLDFDSFSTILCEIEAAINSRPLAAVLDKLDDIEVVTPAHLMLARPLQQVTNISLLQAAPDILQLWATRKRLLRHYLKNWRQQYLLQLRSAHLSSTTPASFPCLNQIVLLDEHPQHRHLWPLARIIATHPGRDGLIRSCSLRTADGRTLRRPLQLLIPLPGIADSGSTTGPPGTVASCATGSNSGQSGGKKEGEEGRSEDVVVLPV